ncbi:peptidase domain-containing ABC transporter [Gloeocapsa sp. PCC 73106]|uniref:peptidase domain-containing ABC transporter n=1 Tax=Gloeocapsa sp. PCC 73106 TaxID=102232 RepID=UPI0002ABF7F2|nr:peptidase domain-containing ABC transporter [Gloeocapsa sp. PCC 73106]ELR97182.1 type I secretion system ABC transporter, HlyB family [Gloeocapsa sp. PCC 73106]
MVYTTTAARDFFANTPPFNQLSPDVINYLSQKAEPLRYPIGQVILKKDEMASQVAIICEGTVRWLGHEPRNKKIVTVGLLQSGFVLGAVNLARGIATETAIASSDEVLCLVLKNQEFTRLLEEHEILRQTFREKCQIIEIFELIGYQLDKTARGEGNLTELATELLPHAQVYTIPAGEHQASAHPELINPQWLWLISGPKTAIDLPPGSTLELTQTDTITIAEPLRLIGVPRQEWEKIENKAISPVAQPLVVETEDLNPEQETEESEATIAFATSPLRAETQSKEEAQGDIKDYPYVKGKTPEETGLACFQMLSKYFGMPFRKDVIQRIVADQIQQQGSLSLDICGAISELMGLNAQLLMMPRQAVTRINTPALVRWQGSLAIIYEISDRHVVLAVPEIGLMRRQAEDFFNSWEDPGQILLLKQTKQTPQERFGLSWFVPYIQKYRRVLIEVFISSFFVQLFALANPLMIQVIIDKVIVQNSPDTLHVLGFFLLIIAIFEAVLTTLRTYLFVDTTNRIDMSLGTQIIDHLLRLPLRYFERRPVGEISTRINELENIRQFLTGTALTVVLDAVFSVIYVVVMLIYSPLLTFVSLGIIPFFVGLTWFFSPIIRRQIRAKAERNAETQSHLVEVMTGIQTVKAQNIELRARWQWQEYYARYVDTGFNTVITSTLAGSMSNFLNKLSALLVLWVGAYLVLEGKLSLGQLIAFRIISGYVTSPILRLTQLWQNFQETALSLERLSDIVDHPQEAEADRDNIPMPLIIGEVQYRDVSFRFKQNGSLQLRNVNLKVAPKTFVGVVGESGAGKSTLTKLLPRLYEPEGGQILIDGYEVNKVELYSLRRQIGMVPQETLLFDGSIRDNIALTNPEATFEEIIKAAKIAVAHEFIMSLSNGYNTRVGERGASLSGGQRQRIAIARSVLQKPRLLILDEATSALDYSTEREVCHNLMGEFKDRTVFFITHRLATIQRADLIILMSEGGIAEEGNHQQLMAREGMYYTLFQKDKQKAQGEN